MAINWALGLPQSNLANDVTNAFQRGSETARANMARAATAALVRDPTNARALEALAKVDPASAQQFQQQQAEQQKAMLAQHQDSIIKGAQILRQFNPQDQQGYTQALAAAQAAGVDISQVPQQFDPNYVQSVIHVADALKPEASSQVVVTPQPGAPAYIYDKASGGVKQIVYPEGQAPQPLTDEQMQQMLNGGQAGHSSPGRFR